MTQRKRSSAEVSSTTFLFHILFVIVVDARSLNNTVSFFSYCVPDGLEKERRTFSAIKIVSVSLSEADARS